MYHLNPLPNLFYRAHNSFFFQELSAYSYMKASVRTIAEQILFLSHYFGDTWQFLF